MRDIVLKTLYAVDFQHISEENDVLEILNWVVAFEETSLEAQDREYIQRILKDFLYYKKEIQDMISAVSHNHSLENMISTDRAVLYLGVFEILFGEQFDVPKKVAVNEAVELSKKYGSSTSNIFVNGVLGKILKEIFGDAVQSEETKVEKKKFVGALVYAIHKGIPYFVF